MQTNMMNGRQFAAWHKMYESCPEYADEVLRYFRDFVMPLTTPEEAITDLIRDDGHEELPPGIANHPVFGMVDRAAKNLVEMN